MDELEEFAVALMDQLAVELNEEKEIETLSTKIKEDQNFTADFEDLSTLSEKIFSQMTQKVSDFTGIQISPELKLELSDLRDFKKLKAKKVFAIGDAADFVDGLFDAIATENIKQITSLIEKDTTKFLVYSTYAKAYLSKISTTYGDFLDSTVYLNKFVLGRYPQIILYKGGPPYDAKFGIVNSGYTGALKMAVLEEQIHSIQTNLHEINKKAVSQVNALNETLAKIILDLDDKTANNLSDYLQLEPVPDEFPTAKRANLFFALNPDNFIVNVLGPDVMTFTKVEIDPKISDMVPQLLEIYQSWLNPIQSHHAVFTTTEGLAEFAVQNILNNDADFQNYLTTFASTDISSYQVRKSMGRDFTSSVFQKFGKKTYEILVQNPPNTRELKEPQKYLNRV